MAALVLDGKATAAQWEAELTQRVAKLKEQSGGKTPILATILVGDDPASATYVKMKGNACRRVGMESLAVELPSSTTTEQLLAKIHELNNDSNVHGILLQHPVPAQIDERACFDAIALSKDVDVVASQCDGNYLSLENSQSGGIDQASRYCGWRSRQTRIHQRRVD